MEDNKLNSVPAMEIQEIDVTKKAVHNPSCKGKKFRKNTLEELRKKRIKRKQKKKEIYKMTKKERVFFWKNKAIQPLQRQVDEKEAKYRHERRISAFYWRKWKEDKAKHLNAITGKTRMIDRNNLKEILDVKSSCTLGEGVFGKVVKKTYRGIEVAEKTFKTGTVSAVNREAAIISSFDHPVLPLVFGVCVDQTPYLLVMQFYGVDGSCMTLSNGLKSKMIEDEACWIPILHSITDGLQYVHQRGYLHNDLKGDNVVITRQDKNYHPVIIDFGKARKVDEAKVYSLTKSKQLEYKKYHKHIAPEVVAGTHSQSFASDIYAFGLIIASVHKVFKNSVSVLEELALSCLNDNPQKRLSIRSLLDRLSSVL